MLIILYHLSLLIIKWYLAPITNSILNSKKLSWSYFYWYQLFSTSSNSPWTNLNLHSFKIIYQKSTSSKISFKLTANLIIPTLNTQNDSKYLSTISHISVITIPKATRLSSESMNSPTWHSQNSHLITSKTIYKAKKA